MKRAHLVQRKLESALEAIQACRDILEANYLSNDIEPTEAVIELTARVFCDFEELATNQGFFLTDDDPGDEDGR